MEKKGFVKKKGMVGILAAAIFLVGFFLVDNAGFTGNAILDSQPSFDPLSLVGLLLVLCSAILAMHAIRSR